jgi:flavin reductase (DIM6/NTAB) family NADH-FMN oxidoreductase RutF
MKMSKRLWKPSTLLNPVPVVMVTCVDKDGNPNIITLAWAGTVNSEPPMLSVSVRRQRYSYDLIKEKGEFVVNLTSEKLACAADFCGVKSGRDVNKFDAMKLTPEKASKVDVPLIKESPINLECVVKNCIELGSHDMFIAEIVAVDVDEKLLDENGKLLLDKAKLICYSHGEYWSLEKQLGFFCYSVARKEVAQSKLEKE